MREDIKRLDNQVVSDGTLAKAQEEWTSQESRIQIEFVKEWTRAVTDDRLRIWNDACISHRFGVRTTNWPAIHEFEAEVGWTYGELEAGVLLHYGDQYGDSAWILPTTAHQTQVRRPKLGNMRVWLGPPKGWLGQSSRCSSNEAEILARHRRYVG